MISDNLISIIIPVYNAGKYLDKCISSAANQTYRNIEILLIDDGSTDASKEICDSWSSQEDKIRVIHQENGGVSKARNTGVKNARGNFLMMIDSDDYISPFMVEELFRGYSLTNADIVICDYEQGELREYSFVAGLSDFRDMDFKMIMNCVYSEGHDALRYISPWGKLYKKALFNGLTYPEGRIFEDIYITHQILYKAERIVVTDQKLMYYFRHADSIMHRPFHLGKLDYLDALKDRMNFFKTHNLGVLEKTAYEEYLHALIWEYSRVRDILRNDKVKREIWGRFREVYRDGYSSGRYPQETALFLHAFNTNPELVIFYWKIKAGINRITGGI